MKACIFVDGYFEKAIKFNTIQEARAFALGVETGAEFGGGGDCAVYILPNDDKAMRDYESKDEVQAAIAYKL